MVIIAATALMCARILGLASPFYIGANDISRWATVRALVDHGTYAIGQRDPTPEPGRYTDKGIIAEPDWQTIDKVLNPDTLRFYSSKPPLLATLVAGEYWLLKKVFGWTITGDDALIIPVILLTFNALPLLIYMVLMARLIEELGTTDWGRFYVLVATCFGSFLLTFANTLNNHTVAGCSALFALYSFLRLWPTWQPPGDGSARVAAPSRLRSAAGFVATGFFAGFTAANELPALSFLCAIGALLLWHAPRRTLGLFVPAAALPIAAFLFTNYLAIGQLRPAYFEGGGIWYRYEGSYWAKIHEEEDTPINIDLAGAMETKRMYALHTVVGHHGILSLTPIYALAFAGILGRLRRRGKRPGLATSPTPDPEAPAALHRSWAIGVVQGMALVLTVTMLVFAIMRTNNYGGMTNGPRWFLWLTPFLLLATVPAADRLSLWRGGRATAYVLLAVSCFSAHYAINSPWDPWIHPWLYDFLKFQGYIDY